jgi:hypothetical protein
MIRAAVRSGSRGDIIISSVGGLLVKRLMLGGRLAKTLAFEGEPVGVVYEPIEDGIGD